MRARTRNLAVLAVAVAVAGLLLARCGDDDGGGKESSDGPARTTTSTTEGPTTTTEPTPPTAEAQALAVTLTDTSFDLAAEATAGPTRLLVTNRGTGARGLVLVELAEGASTAELVAALADDAAAALGARRLVPGPQNVAPGAPQSTLVDLEPGTYAAVATVSGPGAFPPAAAMVRSFTVKAATPPATGTALPSGPTITLDDDGIEVPQGFEGTGLLRVENAGDEPHELLLYRVANDVTFNAAVEHLTAGSAAEGPSPVTPAGGIGALSPGGEAAIDLDLPGGIYVLRCSLPGADGEPHDLFAQVNLP